MQKKLLVIGAGFLQSFIIKKAKELGYYTIAIDKNPNSVGFNYADEIEIIDIIDQEACLEYAKIKKIDGVITAASDYGVLSVSYISKKLNLPGLDYEIAKIIKDKYKIRQKLFQNNVDDISQFYEVKNEKDLSEITPHLAFPLMVKPCDGSGSKGTKKVNSITEMSEACNEAISVSITKKALVEDFIEGSEYGVECFVANNEVHVLGVLGKNMTNPPYYAELGHYIPSKLTIENKVEEIAKKAINCLGIDFGSVNMDVLVTKDNKVCIIDMGARMGGNLIGSHIIPLSTGCDYQRIIIEAALGEKINLNINKTKRSVATNILALKPGEIKKLPDFKKIEKKYSTTMYHQLKVGDIITEYHNNLDGCGYVLSEGDNLNEVINRVGKVKDVVDSQIVRAFN
ncbi:ATP-grasp domain-containing protein [Oceanobacillus oncorhynchi]|uniref:ATP-grasp domain-containing protein n=1 Tax=Oceanobacillus oncorhynchi TaxID=545501 RepID=UPI0034D6505E